MRLPSNSTIRAVRARWSYQGSEPIDIRVFTRQRQLIASGTLSAGDGWTDGEFAASRRASGELDHLQQSDYGTGAFRITGVQFLDTQGEQIATITHGGGVIVRIHLECSASTAEREITFVLGFARHGSAYSVYVYNGALSLTAGRSWTIDVKLDPLRLGSGQWYVNVGVGKANLLDHPSSTYFAVNPGWYHLMATRIDFNVASLTAFDAAGCFTTHPAIIDVRESHDAPIAPGATREVVHDGGVV